MPFQSVDNYDDFVNILADLHSIILETNTSFISIVGDMNANLSSHFGKELIDFCSRLDLIISDADFLNNNSFTYVSDAHGLIIVYAQFGSLTITNYI